MKTPVFFILLSAVLSFTACTKNKVTPLPEKLDGTYTGAFTSSGPGSINTTANVIIAGKTYQGSLNTTFGVLSRGSYVVNNDQITFTDSTVHTANFNWGLLLSGTYTATAKGDDSLILVKKGTDYTYRLKKQ